MKRSYVQVAKQNDSQEESILATAGATGRRTSWQSPSGCLFEEGVPSYQSWSVLGVVPCLFEVSMQLLDV